MVRSITGSQGFQGLPVAGFRVQGALGLMVFYSVPDGCLRFDTFFCQGFMDFSEPVKVGMVVGVLVA